jgi:hypothetical protein
MSHAYRLSALKLLSDIELPELMPWDGGGDAPADLVFRVGEVPIGPDASDDTLARVRDRYLMGYPGETRILIENGRDITVEPACGIDSTDIRSILMAPVQAVMWHQRGLLPLHASAVATNGRAVALAGPSGAGKSTLAAALSGKGLEVLADDICVIDASDGADVLPSTPRLRLWRDSLEHFGIAADGLPRALSRREKYLIECGDWSSPQRRKLAAVVLLSRETESGVDLEQLRGVRSMIELQNVVHMLPAARALGLGPAIFAALTSLPAAGVMVWRLAMPDDRAYLDEAAARILTLFDG